MCELSNAPRVASDDPSLSISLNRVMYLSAAIAADKYITRFKETEGEGSSEATREAMESSHISAGGYT